MKLIILGCVLLLMTAPSAYAAYEGSASGKTADDQSMVQQDTDITQAIRRKITSNSGLSVNAQNIKIITEGGRVVLKGKVDSNSERQKVEQLAKSVAGNAEVINKTVINK